MMRRTRLLSGAGRGAPFVRAGRAVASKSGGPARVVFTARALASKSGRPASVALAALAVACGGDGGDEKTPVELYSGQYASATCAVMQKCCTDNGLTFDENQCALGGAGYLQTGVDRNVAAGAALDPDLADQCISAAVAATSKCVPVPDDATARAACAIVWSGPKKVGESCTADIDCESSRAGQGVCIHDQGAATGTCAKKTSTAKLGDVCGKTAAGPTPTAVADCEGNGLQCNILSQTCSALVPLGGSCNEFDRCEKGLFCDSGACATALAAGAVCFDNTPEQCASGLCVRGKCGANGVGAVTPCTGAKQ